MKKIGIIYNILKNNIFLKNNDKRFIKHNKKIWKSKKGSAPKRIILTDFYPLREHFIMSSFFLNILARKHNSKIVMFSIKPIFWKRVFVYLYKSINVTENIVLNRYKTDSSKNIASKLFENLNSKNDLMELTYKNITIGIDIYETYLRILSEPTVEISDPRLKKMIVDTVEQVEFLFNYFKENEISSCVLSHDCYIPNNLVAKIAYYFNIPVYLPNSRGIYLVTEQFDTYKYFANFHEMFQKLSAEEQKEALEMTKSRMDKRFSGEVGVDMSYSTKSAFHNSTLDYRIVKKNSKPKILILTHDFYDNPHAYEQLLFSDFHEWLKFLVKVSEETDYDWYIKSHPDTSSQTITIINELFLSNPKFTIVPLETSHFQLVNEGIEYALTVYGSVGHEYPLMGVKVINAGYNPHIAYTFNYHIESLSDYNNVLKNLDRLDIQVNKKDIYECYYMHYYYTFVDNIIFNSYREIIDQMKKYSDESMIYYLYLNEFNEKKYLKTMSTISAFLDSGEKYLFEFVQDHYNVNNSQKKLGAV